MGHYPEDNTGCTCDTPTGSESRLCSFCKQSRSLENFDYRNDRKSYRPYCKKCRTKKQRKNYAKYKTTSPFKCRATKLKAKCKHQKIKYNLNSDYLQSIWTGKCPVFNRRIMFNKHRNFEFHAELDRINPKKGYTKGNVVWLSRKANRIKNNAKPKEVLALAKWLKNVTT